MQSDIHLLHSSMFKSFNFFQAAKKRETKCSKNRVYSNRANYERWMSAGDVILMKF